MDATVADIRRILVFTACVLSCVRSYAGSPPLFTDDPETPGYQGWEINITNAFDHTRTGSELECPLFDINYGLTSDRDQLKVEFAVLENDPEDAESEWGISDLLVGYKYRFLDEDEAIGWAVSLYPQVACPTGDADRGLGSGQTELFLPFEFQKSFCDGKAWINPEIGFSVELGGGNAESWKFGLATGYEFENGLELQGEVGDFVFRGGVEPDDPFFNLGFAYSLHKNLVLIGSAGRSFVDARNGTPDFFCLLGVQILLGAAADEDNPAHEEGGETGGDEGDEASRASGDMASWHDPRGQMAAIRNGIEPYLVNPATY